MKTDLRQMRSSEKVADKKLTGHYDNFYELCGFGKEV